jgi:hypothetical protein
VYENNVNSITALGETFWTRCEAFCRASEVPCKAWWIFHAPEQKEAVCYAISAGTLQTQDWDTYYDLLAELVD